MANGRNRSPSPGREAELLSRIHEALPEEIERRYEELTARRRAETLEFGGDEHEELIRLTEEFERLDARRLESLIELARLRGKSLAEVLRDPDVAEKAPVHG